ncbi:hypothetical protein CRG98_020473 [Punica granatum]|uniref:Uncharacterized protein n=1 Tax=Punica granatum TaxID=22663 RepID=A0A2I0JS17_PUNGR|nr:hypothetical protein CRG98_020473 [Punica granatum]
MTPEPGSQCIDDSYSPCINVESSMDRGPGYGPAHCPMESRGQPFFLFPPSLPPLRSANSVAEILQRLRKKQTESARIGMMQNLMILGLIL